MSALTAAHGPSSAHRRVRRSRLLGLAVVAALAAFAVRPVAPAAADPTTPAGEEVETPAAAVVDLPEVLTGDAALRHHREDLMPYWDLPEALGDPMGNFPTFRGRNGELLPDQTTRGLTPLARQVYGYCVAFQLTGEDRYLSYARAGLDWILEHAKDTTYGGYFGELDIDGNPVDPLANKDLFDLAELGLAYGAYYNVTRDASVEAELLAVRDLIFERYYDAAAHRMKDSLTYDLSTEVDTVGNGEDITDLLVPATAISLSNWAILSDPTRQAQFKSDLRELVLILIARHKNDGAANANNRFWFWGRGGRIGNFNSIQTDFGHNLLSYAVIYNANNVFPDRPWDGLAADRNRLLTRAWDDVASRWNQKLVNFQAGNVQPDSAGWIHNEADQLLATIDLYEGPTNIAQLARSMQTWLDVYVDRDPAYPARETFARVERTGTMTDLRKTHEGKNMFHPAEHALIMYLHGRAMAEEPARLFYAFPADQALTAVATPYWFSAAGETRTVTGEVATLPGRKVVEVAFTGIGQAARPPYPAPDDTTPPTSTATVSPAANDAGWSNQAVTLDIAATDDVAGVKEVHVLVHDASGLTQDRAVIEPGATTTLPLAAEGEYDVSWFAVDLLGNRESLQSIHVGVDLTAPTVTGLPPQDCEIWPPNGHWVTIADVVADDSLAGVADLTIEVTANEPLHHDVLVTGGVVNVRADRDQHRHGHGHGHGDDDGRVYTVTATVTDLAGNVTVAAGSCTVPHDQGHHGGHH